MTCCIFQVLERSYEWVVCEESYSLLKALLTCNSDQKFVLARGYIKTSQLSDPQVTAHISNPIIWQIITLCLEVKETYLRNIFYVGKTIMFINTSG